jgi:hypothetical protein
LWTATNSSNARSAVGLEATWLTNTNVTNFRTAIGLGATNNVVFGAVEANALRWDTSIIFGIDDAMFYVAPNFDSTNIAATTRTNVGLPLAALTNTSNVTAMRALSGSTNTNHPFSGAFVFVDDASNTWSATVSNGIIQFIVEQ